METTGEERKEEHAYVLDFMHAGKSSSSRSEPLAQLLGERFFTLLEATTKPEATVAIGEKVYIGTAERDKILLIKARIQYSELTQTARNCLEGLVMQIVNENEQKYVEVFNKAGALNIRQHLLELLPGIGRKHLDAILKERQAKPFASFADITQRVALMQDPAKIIVDRIMLEIQGSERFYLFVKPYYGRKERG